MVGSVLVRWHEGGRERERLHLGAGLLRLEDVESSASQSQSVLAQLSDTDSDSDPDTARKYFHISTEKISFVLRILVVCSLDGQSRIGDIGGLFSNDEESSVWWHKRSLSPSSVV